MYTNCKLTWQGNIITTYIYILHKYTFINNLHQQGNSLPQTQQALTFSKCLPYYHVNVMILFFWLIPVYAKYELQSMWINKGIFDAYPCCKWECNSDSITRPLIMYVTLCDICTTRFPTSPPRFLLKILQQQYQWKTVCSTYTWLLNLWAIFLKLL